MVPKGIVRSLSRRRVLSLALGLALGRGSAKADPPPVFLGRDGEFRPIAPPMPVPRARFALEPGMTRDLAAFQPRLLLVNFWATWCAPCVAEMPALDRLQADFEPLGFSVIAIAIDRSGPEKTAPFYRRLGLKHLALYSDRESRLYNELAPGGLPASFIVDRKARLAARLIGPADWDSAEARAFIRYYIDLPWL